MNLENQKAYRQNEKLFTAIGNIIDKQIDVDLTPYKDLFDFCVSIDKDTKDKEISKQAHRWSKRLRNMINRDLPRSNCADELYELYNNSLLFDATVDFDAYMLYLEKNRKPRERFYQPRRKQLMPIVREMQKLLDDELDRLEEFA